MDIRTLLVEQGGDGEWGVSVDIFPVDGLPDLNEAHNMFEKTRKFRRLIANQRFTYKGEVSSSYSFGKNASIVLGKIMHPFLSLNGLLVKMDKMMQKYDFDNCEYCGCLCWRELVFKTALLKPVNHVFEDAEFVIPEGYDSVLRIIFGDYMQLPPEEQRVSRHGSKAYWR